MMGEDERSIEISRETLAALDAKRRADESADDAIARLLDETS